MWALWVQNWLPNTQWPDAICGQNTWPCLYHTELARSEIAAHQIWYSLLPHSSVGVAATTLKPSSPTLLCYSIFSSWDPGIPQFTPLFQQEWLGTCLHFSLMGSHPNCTCKQSCTHICTTIHSQKHPDLRTSLILLKVWSTLNSDHVVLAVILLGLENLQRWRFHYFSGHPVPFVFFLVKFHDAPSACSSSLPRSNWRAALTLSIPPASPLFAFIWKNRKVVLHLLLQVTDEDIKFYRPQDRHLRDATCNQFPGSMAH